MGSSAKKGRDVKFLVVGLGSMGKRRIRNLKHLRAGEIIGFDTREDRRKEVEKEYSIKTFDEFGKAIRDHPDALIISTPPDLHVKYAMEAVKNDKHFFMELNVVEERMNELIEKSKKKDIIAAPSCTMRFHPSVKKIKEIVDDKRIGDALLFTYHSGQYLPDWHPWEDYRTFFVAKKETGGGRELVSFELVWLTWIFGNIDTISCFKGKLSKLDVDIDDTYQIIMKFESGALGHMLVDVISRTLDRSCKIFGGEGLIFWDWSDRLKVYTSKDKRWITYRKKAGTTVRGYIEKIKEEPYIEEMNAFIRAIKGEIVYPYTLQEDKRRLEVLCAAEKSSNTQKHVKIMQE